MNTIKKMIGILFIGIIISSCSSDDDSSNTTSNLVGTWDWVRSSGGITGEIITPASTDSTMKLEITNTMIKRYINDDLIFENRYTIEIRETMSGEPREMIVESNGSREIIDLERSTLTLTGDCSDCFISDYEKNN